jgi:hypothetical protein
MIGQTVSTAKTAKGQMNDYKASIEQLTMQYNRMTDAQKKSIGQDYLNAIEQLKQKYPSFDLMKALDNQAFRYYISPQAFENGHGMSVEQAYGS